MRRRSDVSPRIAKDCPIVNFKREITKKLSRFIMSLKKLVLNKMSYLFLIMST